MIIANFVTNFADQAVMLPLVIAVGIGLCFSGWYRGAFAWISATAFTWAIIFVLKLACLACGPLMIGGLHSPSGHTASAAAAFGGLIGLMVRWRGGGWQWTVPISAGLAIMIGLSRLALHVHTVTDVVVAGIIGVTGATVLVALAGTPSPKLRLSPVIGTMAAIALFLHGSRLPAEAAIRHFAAWHAWERLQVRGYEWQTCRLPVGSSVIGSAKARVPSSPAAEALHGL